MEDKPHVFSVDVGAMCPMEDEPHVFSEDEGGMPCNAVARSPTRDIHKSSKCVHGRLLSTQDSALSSKPCA